MKKKKKKESNLSVKSAKKAKSLTPKRNSKKHNSIVGGVSEKRRIKESKSICSNNSDLEQLFPNDFSGEKHYQDVITGPKLRKRKSVPRRSPSPIFGKKNSIKKVSVNK